MKPIPYILIGASFVAAGYAVYLSGSAILAAVLAVILLVVGVFFAIGMHDSDEVQLLKEIEARQEREAKR